VVIGHLQQWPAYPPYRFLKLCMELRQWFASYHDSSLYISFIIHLPEICKISPVPVIIVSAKETTRNKINLLRLGADDYMTKPFALEEFPAVIASTIPLTGQ